MVSIDSCRYGLTAWEVENKLPLLDTHKTNLLKYCPDYLAPLKCTPGRYRRFDGLCNNLYNPTWGARLTTFTRYITDNSITINEAFPNTTF